MAHLPWTIARAHRQRGSDADPSRPRPARRSLYACGLMIVGFLIAEHFALRCGSVVLFAVGAGACVGAILMRGWACRCLLALAVVALAAGWYELRIHERAAGDLSRMIEAARHDPAGGEVVVSNVRGTVRDVPRRVAMSGGALERFGNAPPTTAFTVSVASIGSLADGGVLRVRVECDVRSLPETVRPGAVVTIRGKLRPIGRPMNPGEPDWQALAAQDGVVGTLDVPEPALITLDKPHGVTEWCESAWRGAIGGMRLRCLRVLGLGPGDAPPTPSRALLGALLLGEHDRSLDEVNDAFMRLGLVHLVAISGFNLAVMAGVVMALLRLTGDRGWLEPVIVAVLVVGYMLVLPAQAPILRAGAIVLILLVSSAIGRRYDPATLLGWVACGVLIMRPMDAWSMGFQLSFGIVAALLVFGDTMHQRLWGVPIRGLAVRVPRRGHWLIAWVPPTLRWVIEAVKAQISAAILAWGISLPIIAAGTGQINVLAPLTTLVVLPITVVVLWAGYVVLLAGVVLPSVAAAVSGALDICARVLVEVVMRLDAVGGGFIRLPPLGAVWAIACGATVVIVLSRLRLRDWRVWVSVLILAGWLVAQVALMHRAPSDSILRIDTLSVGQGSCHVLRSGADVMLVDCGSTDTGLGVRRVPQVCRALGVRRVPTIFVSSAAITRLAGVVDVLEPLGVGTVVVPSQMVEAAAMYPDGPAGVMLNAIRTRGVVVRAVGAGDRIELGRVVGMVVVQNEGRIAVRFEGVDRSGTPRSAMFLGDLPGDVLRDAQDAIGSHADVVDLPRHGAMDDATAGVVRTLAPGIAVQSSARRRAERSTWAELLPRTHVWSTAKCGAVWTELLDDGQTMSGALWSGVDRDDGSE